MPSSIPQPAVYFLIVVVTSILVSVFWIEFLSGFKKEIKAFKFINKTAKKNSTKPMSRAIESKKNSTHVILIYNGHYLKLFMEHFRKKKCSLVKNCIVTDNVKDINKSHAVIFTHSNLPRKPPFKGTNQFWIFHAMETVHYTHKPPKHWDDKFDFTMSFRRHSEVLRSYGKIVRREKELMRNYSEVFRKKKFGAVWMSGHCPVPSKRKALAQELGKYMHVDLFGSCGTRSCGGRTTLLSDCLKNVSRDYKFYLAFENTICPDYTTEKLFNLFLYDLEIVPVVNGPPNAAKYIPNGTFINYQDFPSASELAKKLIEIGLNEENYTKYLKEKDKYRDIGNGEVFSDAMCQLCDKLANNLTRNSSQNYWTWMLKNKC